MVLLPSLRTPFAREYAKVMCMPVRRVLSRERACYEDY
jgi:hypothetical protein